MNLTRINMHAKENETIIVPGKVLGGGELDHKVNVYAYCFSCGAAEKIASLKGDCKNLRDLMKSNPKAKNVRVIG